MQSIRIFIAAPMSGFANEEIYKQFRRQIMFFIDRIRKDFDVYSELIKIGSLDIYDEPGQAMEMDFKEIEMSDVFLLFHPARMQTSSMIELGYACAKDKKIILVANTDNLPYLALGVPYNYSDSILINVKTFDRECFDKIYEYLCRLKQV